MKTALAFLLLLSVAPLQKITAQNLKSNIPYATPAHYALARVGGRGPDPGGRLAQPSSPVVLGGPYWT